MVIFPNCKINIGLQVVGKRPDGYHNLETIFYPIPVYDVLEIIENDGEEDAFFQTGIALEGASDQNLCVKAVRLMRSHIPDLPPVRMHLHKTIPAGAGLGGGSSDGAHALILLNQKFKLGLSVSQLSDMALQLGSDCPFFITNEPLFASGRGEILTPISLPLSGYRLVLINPGIHVPTGWAFSQITPASPVFSLAALGQTPLHKWPMVVSNDFLKPVASQYPVIQQILEYCLGNGAVFASMSGSGSTCYALFAPGSTMPLFESFSAFWVRTINIP